MNHTVQRNGRLIAAGRRDTSFYGCICLGRQIIECAAPGGVSIGIDLAIQCNLSESGRVHHCLQIGNVYPSEICDQMRLRFADQVLHLEVAGKLAA